MKVSLALGERRPLDRTTAWGCLTANLAMPGSGTLVAGRRRGYVQGLLALAGMGLTTVFGLRFFAWYFANYARLQEELADPVATAGEIWIAVRWALLGMALFALGWLWALGSSLILLRDARRAGSGPPPVLPA
jgi:hypothetical protein